MSRLLPATRLPVAPALGYLGVAGFAALLGVVASSDVLSVPALVVLALLPVFLLVFAAYLRSDGGFLVALVIGAQAGGAPVLADPVFSGPLNLFVADVVILLALLHAFLRSGARAPEPRVQGAGLIACLVVLLGVAMAPAILRGNAEYGASLVGNPARIVAYAVIGFALVGLRAQQLELYLRVALSAAVVVSAVTGTYYLATGGAETSQVVLSTGGRRTLSLSTGLYTGMAALFALLVAAWRPRRARPWLEWVVLTAAVYVQFLALGRTVILSLAVLSLVVILLIARSRRNVALACAVLVPLTVVALSVAQPSTPAEVATAKNRVFGSSVQDQNVRWRANAVEAVLQDFDGEELLGAGFGRNPTFVDGKSLTVITGGDPHNGYVYLLTSGGIATLAIFLLICAVALGRGLQRVIGGRGDPGRLVATWALSSLILLLATVATEPQLSQPRHLLAFWTVALIPIVVRGGTPLRPRVAAPVADAPGPPPVRRAPRPAVTRAPAAAAGVLDVSVIVPVKDDAARLGRCLAALEGQATALRFEVLVVDNGSSDDPGAVVERFAFARLLSEPAPSSYAARNRALAEARGRVLAFTDSDCVPAPDWLERGVAALDAGTGRCFVGGRVEVFPADPLRPTPVELYEMFHAFPQDVYVERHNFAVTANLFVLKAVLTEIGPFDAGLASGGDRDWGRRAVLAGLRPVYRADVVVAHPARRSLSELTTKLDRTIKGAAQLPDTPLARRMRRPPLRTIARNLRAVRPATFQARGTYVAISLCVYAIKQWKESRALRDVK